MFTSLRALVHIGLMFGEECTLPMDVGLRRRESDLPYPITSPYAIWVCDALEVAYDQVRRHSGQGGTVPEETV